MSRAEPGTATGTGPVYFTKTIGEFDVYTFAGITGDYYPVHIDAEYAAHHPVGERVAHGVLIMGLMSTAAGRWMVEKSIDGLSYGYDSVRFTAPVRFGDTISISYLPENGTDDGHKIYSRVEARNQRGEVVAVARHIVWR
ncbi:MaoC family dehydratase, partial [Nocardia cerradoensis]